ncbi:hypothetical protein [Carnobacterium divergens]|uniref:hypothetical protein n=1 Tax=Carnobacterium divergens TaxID=2748 RepID=UPI0028912F5F|nr:hypothetical protein [Carnobacterium divergens]MDT2010802.1 hypothetical protein [Carnobacterium divergens]
MILISWVIVGTLYYFFIYDSISNNIVMAVAVGVVLLLLPAIAIFLFYKWNLSRGGFFLRLEHRQWLARMVIHGRMYNSVTVKRSSGTTSVTKEKIVYFPKIYYQYSKGLINLRFPLDLQQHQDRFLKMKEALEHAFYSDCIGMVEERGYVLYKLLYDPSKRRKDVSEI